MAAKHPYRETTSEEPVAAPGPTPAAAGWPAAMTVVGGVLAIAGGVVHEGIGLSGAVVFLAGLGGGWWQRRSAINRLQRLPFRVVHDRQDVLDASLAPRPLLSLQVVMRTQPADFSLPPQPKSLAELAELLATWGVAMHERFGIAEVSVHWGARPGPPSL